MPNIKGKYRSKGQTNIADGGGDWSTFANGTIEGCFTDSNGGHASSADVSPADIYFLFNASKSSLVYQDGANVRPNYYNVEWYIKYK